MFEAIGITELFSMFFASPFSGSINQESPEWFFIPHRVGLFLFITTSPVMVL
jgi:hypothetical protein